MRMMEHIPGITASSLFAVNRGANTLMRGGFMDDRLFGPGKLGGFKRGAMTPTAARRSAYFGTRSRQARMLASSGADAKMPWFKGARLNNITARPRALSRFSSLTAFNAAEKTKFYSPFQFMAHSGGGLARRSTGFMKEVYGANVPAKGEQIFQRGMLSMMTAGRRLDKIEAKAASGSLRAAAKLQTAQMQVERLALMNNPSLLPANQALRTAAFGSTPTVGLTGNIMASAGSTTASRYTMGYVRGALGHAAAGGLEADALRGANQAVRHMGMALRGNDILAKKALSEGVFKTLGAEGVSVTKTFFTKEGAKVLGARTAAMAIPGLNMLATASLVYDLGKMGGELVKSGLNLAKDAVKSMKGSIDKPLFGMGYKDNEVAATSRARGVMAIQNSRLNARSLLGSEGSMMAAHFG